MTILPVSPDAKRLASLNNAIKSVSIYIASTALVTVRKAAMLE